MGDLNIEKLISAADDKRVNDAEVASVRLRRKHGAILHNKNAIAPAPKYLALSELCRKNRLARYI